MDVRATTEPWNAAALAVEIDERLRDLPELYTERVRALRRDYSRRLARATPEQMLSLADRLLDYPTFTHHFLAYELLAYHRPGLRRLGPAEMALLGRHLDCWQEVDTFACYLSGPAWRERQIGDELIHQWAASPDRWWRRASLVSTVPLNNQARGGRGDTGRTLAVCALLVADRDDMVVKAMSWALRELSRRDSAAVRRFLDDHGPRLAARVRREVQNKLDTGLKNPRPAAS